MDTETQIQKDAKTMLEKMGFNLINNPSVQKKEDVFYIDVFVDDPTALIGQKGENLITFQKVFRMIASNKYYPGIKINLDANGYKRKREGFIRSISLSARKRALSENGGVYLRPMTSYERRIVHSTLAGFSDVLTQSYGEGSSRRVKVEPSAQEA